MSDLLSHQVAPSVWWGWGDPAEADPFPAHGWKHLRREVGAATYIPGDPVALEDVAVPPVALPQAAFDAAAAIVGVENVHTDHEQRVRHAAGKSFPDLAKIRAGNASGAPDAVITPTNAAQVGTILQWAQDHSVAVIPFGGGTSVVGGLSAATTSPQPAVCVDLSHLDALRTLDPVSQTATLDAGMRGPAIETALREHGFTLGHYPQSHQQATIGGYAATRSAGQASTGYGRSDDIIVGLTMATPVGQIVVDGSAPASAAGPQLLELCVGSEGTLGVITDVTVRVTPRPEHTEHAAYAFTSFTAAADAIRRMAQTHGMTVLPDVCRVSDEDETRVSLALAGRGGSALIGYLRTRRLRSPVLLICRWEGQTDIVQARRKFFSSRLARWSRETDAKVVTLPAAVASGWARHRFASPYTRDELLGAGYLVDTLETATSWSNLHHLHQHVRSALTSATGRRIVVQCHISHVYPTGASLYFTFVTPQEQDSVDQWTTLKSAASRAIVAGGGTITHHHAVGTDHRPYLTTEIGSVGVRALRALKDSLDPLHIMNPGVLIPERDNAS